MVILGVYTNDIMDLNAGIRQWFARPVLLAETAPDEGTALETFLRNNVALYTALMEGRRVYREEQINRVTPTIEGLRDLYLNLTFLQASAVEYQAEWEQYGHLLWETTGLLADEGIPLVIVMFPDLAQLPEEGGLPDTPQTRVAEMAADTPFLDMLPVFRESGDVESLYLMHYHDGAAVDPDAPDAAVMAYTGDGHLSPYGNLVTARAVAAVLLEQGIVRDD